ncbi:hypothetical protein KIPB_014360, partial [Kipferlia bialata]
VIMRTHIPQAVSSLSADTDPITGTHLEADPCAIGLLETLIKDGCGTLAEIAQRGRRSDMDAVRNASDLQIEHGLHLLMDRRYIVNIAQTHSARRAGIEDYLVAR